MLSQKEGFEPPSQLPLTVYPYEDISCQGLFLFYAKPKTVYHPENLRPI